MSNNVGRMANSVDPDQTGPWSSLIRVYTVCYSTFVPIFWIIMIVLAVNKFTKNANLWLSYSKEP